MAVYFTSDQHFSHKNIVEFEPCRMDAMKDWSRHNFGTDAHLAETYHDIYSSGDKGAIQSFLSRTMDEMMIERWNSVVKDNDIVWFLGDFSFGTKEYTASLVKRLKGIKKMVMGNHDHFKAQEFRDMGFTFVSEYPVLLQNHFLLSHAPIFANMVPPFFNIYGHVHSHEAYQTSTEHTLCVCVERHNFKPVRCEAFDNYVEEEFKNPVEERGN